MSRHLAEAKKAEAESEQAKAKAAQGEAEKIQRLAETAPGEVEKVIEAKRKDVEATADLKRAIENLIP